MGCTELDVSRETMERLHLFMDLVVKWTASINLISNKSIPDLWNRHILDSGQIYKHAPDFNHWVDIGSGAGFPAIVVAVIAHEKNPFAKVSLIESDQRKATFLRTVVRELELNAAVICGRIENVERQNADVLSARALANLRSLLAYADRHMSTSGTALFQKGSTWQVEVADARQSWEFQLDAIESATKSDAAILRIKDIVCV